MVHARARTRIQTRAALLASAGLLAVGLFGHGLGAAPSYSPDNQESAFLGLINEYRAQNGLGSLVIQDELGAAADFHSQDMATNDYFDHYLSDGSGPGDNIAAFGYSGDTWGENIAAGMATAPEALVAWKNSPGHNAAMLDPDYIEIGIGRYYDPESEYGWYWTTTFGGGEDGASPSRQPRNTSTTTINESTLDGVDGSGDGRVTTTVNGRPVRGGNIVNADGEIITTIDNNGEAPIERTTTVNEQPSVANGADWDQSASYDSYSAAAAPADSYTPADSYAAEDTYAAAAADSYAAEDTYGNGNGNGEGNGGRGNGNGNDGAGEADYAAADSYAAGDSYAAADSYAADTYNGEITVYQTIEAEQDGVVEPPTVNGVPVEDGAYIEDASNYGRRNRDNNAAANGPTVVYGDIDGGSGVTSINADGGYNSGANTNYPSGGGAPNTTTTTTSSSPDGTMTTTTTINGITMNDGVSTTYGDTNGRGASADPGQITYGN